MPLLVLAGLCALAAFSASIHLPPPEPASAASIASQLPAASSLSQGHHHQQYQHQQQQLHARRSPSPATIARLRQVDYPPRHALDLQAAKALHQDITSRARAIEALHGHVRATLPAPRLVSSPARAGLYSHAGNASVPTIFPTDYGADPTGTTDSSAAFTAAVAALLRGGAPHHMAEGIHDLGGATLDLAGGQYLLSEPVVIPPYYGNLLIARGTLRASSSFPSDKWLLMIGDPSCNPPSGQGSCNEFVNVNDVLFDSSHVAAGGVFVSHVMGTTIGPAFFTGYHQAGILVDGGHEVMITETWLAEYYWSEPQPSNSTSIGIQVNGNDHYLDDVIVFDYTHTGVEINGAANILSGVHTWNGGGVGIAINSYQTRLIGCYLDYNVLVIKDPEQTVVENTFFLATHTVLHASRGTVATLLMRFNTYTGGDSVVLDGTFTRTTGVSIVEEINGNKFTRARATLALTASTSWRFDFSSTLLFPTIDFLTYSLATSAGPVAHVAMPPQGRTVEIRTAQPVDAVVSVEVAQAL